ncbi:MAG: hypothetical protein ABI680_19960, partial [Chthoniobacteraceae bacterium]
VAAQHLQRAREVLGNWPLAVASYNHGVAGMVRARTAVGIDSLDDIVRGYDSASFGFASRNFYAEVLAGEDSFEAEGKLLLQKNFGPLRIAYNLILEAEWEGKKFGNFDERNGEFAQTLGISYDLNRNFSVGAEVLHEIPLPDWSEAADSNVFIGPNASVRFGRVFVTATALFQVTNVEAEPDAQVRLITGFDF